MNKTSSNVPSPDFNTGTEIVKHGRWRLASHEAVPNVTRSGRKTILRPGLHLTTEEHGKKGFVWKDTPKNREEAIGVAKMFDRHDTDR